MSNVDGSKPEANAVLTTQGILQTDDIKNVNPVYKKKWGKK